MPEKLRMQETQQVSLEILKRVTDVCEAQGFRYFLIYGTLIGAIRHKGFIPWDDDVDIMMPRPDHDRLLSYLNEHPLQGLSVFYRDICPSYPYMITRISDDRYVIRMKNERPYGLGVFIDIYPFDGLGNEKEKAIRFGLRGDHLSSLCYQASREHFAVETTTSRFRRLVKKPVFHVSKRIGKDFFQDRLEKMKDRYPYDESTYVGCVTWLSWGIKDMFLRKWFDSYQMAPFEKYRFRIPQSYDKILSHTYGDYMTLPREEDRHGHHDYIVYRKSQ